MPSSGLTFFLLHACVLAGTSNGVRLRLPWTWGQISEINAGSFRLAVRYPPPPPSLVEAPADPTEMFPGVGNCVSTPVFAVAGIISRPFPNGCLTTPCLIGQSVPLPLVQLQERRPQRLEVQLWPIFTRFLLQSFETPLKWEINLLFSRKHVLCGDATGTVFKWGNHLPENWIFFTKKNYFFWKLANST